MKILGIDWGKKRIGLAVSEGSFAEPFGTVSSFEELKEVVRQEGISQAVLGLPEGKLEKEVREFGYRIENEIGIPVVFRSEVLTSRQALQKLIEAGRSLHSRRSLDARAAALLLQEYLDIQPD